MGNDEQYTLLEIDAHDVFLNVEHLPSRSQTYTISTIPPQSHCEKLAKNFLFNSCVYDL